MGTTDDPYRLVECSDCGALAVGGDEVGCCGSAMTPVGRPGDDATDATPSPGAPDRADDFGDPPEPDLDELLRVVFGMSPAELDVCLCVMEHGTLTVAELTDRVGYDRSVVARHLNHLADLGVVEKRRQILDRGGDVYVYTPESPETVRRRFRELFLRWAAAGVDRIDDLSRRKVEGIAEAGSATEWTVFRES
ncbi:MarR family transcriptional regulator [Halobaculum magnesiiphilum]|uniref:MarR family transcriptional regulator n=1 Tax=Halobaculum magnesiiphilum TaxID=1017351 RepID=A0A8T8WAI1_9EURY|nr:MarR family transcriptional regulator [Halobaculum magnesiiphilum]QZP36869.1 MarR family transcriptional regulator [Halobaculum magnesiiphilum]